MATSPLSFRLEEALADKLRLDAEHAGRQLSTHVSQIVEAHLGNHQSKPSLADAEKQDQIAQLLRQISQESQTLHRVFAQKSRENDADMQTLNSRIDELRVDLCTAVAVILEMSTDLDAEAAADWARKYLKPPPLRAPGDALHQSPQTRQ